AGMPGGGGAGVAGQGRGTRSASGGAPQTNERAETQRDELRKPGTQDRPREIDKKEAQPSDAAERERPRQFAKIEEEIERHERAVLDVERQLLRSVAEHRIAVMAAEDRLRRV